jgi:hypothetical protein
LNPTQVTPTAPTAFLEGNGSLSNTVVFMTAGDLGIGANSSLTFDVAKVRDVNPDVDPVLGAKLTFASAITGFGTLDVGGQGSVVLNKPPNGPQVNAVSGGTIQVNGQATGRFITATTGGTIYIESTNNNQLVGFTNNTAGGMLSCMLYNITAVSAAALPLPVKTTFVNTTKQQDGVPAMAPLGFFTLAVIGISAPATPYITLIPGISTINGYFSQPTNANGIYKHFGSNLVSVRLDFSPDASGEFQATVAPTHAVPIIGSPQAHVAAVEAAFSAFGAAYAKIFK